MIARQIVRACRSTRPLVLHYPLVISGRAGFASPTHDHNSAERVVSQDGECRDAVLENQLVHKGTITTNQPNSTDMMQLLDALRPVSSSIDVTGDSQFELAVLLTPSYAQHALDPDFPLKIFDRIKISTHQLTRPLAACTAVVDRLPSPTANKTGSEGFGFVLQSMPTLPNKPLQIPAKQSAQTPGFLTFGIPRLMDATGGCDVQCTLAQTMFYTGRASTLQHVQYEYNESIGRHEKRASQMLAAQKLILPPAKSLKAGLCLIPLTPFRTVRKCVGNIVRSLSAVPLSERTDTDQKSEGSQPASQELEKAISQYFVALKIEPEVVEVWALVAPNFTTLSTAYPNPKKPLDSMQSLIRLSTDEIQERWTSQNSASGKQDEDIANATIRMLQHGGRLCRVLSGGGGWGKKAGLLSLDPDLAYSTRELRADEGWKIDMDRHSFGESATAILDELGHVVRPGEHMSFLLASRPKSITNVVGFPDGGISFGTIPSTIDTPAAADSGPCSLGEETQTVLFSDAFGALSETGLALSFTSARGVSHSKLDVPFSRIHIEGIRND